MEIYYIYTLKDPQSEQIRYVGYTKKTLAERLRMHLKNVREAEQGTRKWNKRLCWLKSVLLLGNIPIIEELEVCNSKSDSYISETYWISQFKQWGFNLVNMTLGGDGGDTFSYQSPEKQEEIRSKISKKSLGHTQSKETKDKFKQAIKVGGHWLTKPGAVHPMQGKHATEESKAKMSKAKLGRKMPEDQRLARLGRTAVNKNKSKYPMVIQVSLEGEDLATFYTAGDAVRTLGLAKSSISSIIACCHKTRKKAVGYYWKFKED